MDFKKFIDNQVDTIIRFTANHSELEKQFLAEAGALSIYKNFSEDMVTSESQFTNMMIGKEELLVTRSLDLGIRLLERGSSG